MWLRADVDIYRPRAKSSETFKLLFSAEVNGIPAKFAVDDFELVEGTCSQVSHRLYHHTINIMTDILQGANTRDITSLFL